MDQYDEEYTREFINVPWLESRAVHICEYQALLVPGLLQTADYAKTVIWNADGATASEEEMRRWLELRLERQRVLFGEEPRRFTTVLEEYVLRRPIGGTAVMQGQLEHLLNMSERGNVDLLVMPTEHGTHAGDMGSFTLYKMPYELSCVAYVESLGGALYIEAPRVGKFEHAWEDLRCEALDSQQSNALIKTILKETRL